MALWLHYRIVSHLFAVSISTFIVSKRFKVKIYNFFYTHVYELEKRPQIEIKINTVRCRTKRVLCSTKSSSYGYSVYLFIFWLVYVSMLTSRMALKRFFLLLLPWCFFYNRIKNMYQPIFVFLTDDIHDGFRLCSNVRDEFN